MKTQISINNKLTDTLEEQIRMNITMRTTAMNTIPLIRKLEQRNIPDTDREEDAE